MWRSLGPRWTGHTLLLIGGIALADGLLGGAKAQTQLPGIVVTTPSPVRHPARPHPAAALQATTPAPGPATAEPAPAVQIPVEPSFVAEPVVTGTDLAAQPYAQLGDALATTPGLGSTSFAPGASR